MDQDDLFEWLHQDGLPDLMGKLTAFFESKPFIHVPDSVKESPESHTLLEELRRSFAAFTVIHENFDNA